MHGRRAEAGGLVAGVLRALAGSVVLVTLGVSAVFAGPATAAAGGGHSFAPRIRHAMGVEPAHGGATQFNPNSVPVAYHGGPVMRDVTIHTLFWAPPGYRFDGSPSDGVLGYQALIQQFLSDVASASGSQANVFSALAQYGDGGGNGGYVVHYNPAVDSITDTSPFPAPSGQCPSPSGTATCLTDLQLQRELDRVIGSAPNSARGLSNLWFVFLPPDVDTCIALASCATNAYAGYHSLFDLGHGSTVYAAIPDPLLEFTPPPGADPQGNPEAEVTIDTVAHEAIEAITDPKGTGWMDPNGFETGDKCENGPQQGTPLGYAPDGSPYNQVIGGHQYLIQDIWSNARGGCVSSSTAVGSTPGLHTVVLNQFSPVVRGSLGADAGRRVPVTVILARAGQPVATAHTESRPGGAWGPVTLRGRGGRPHAVGDDRDQIEIAYGSSPTSPAPDYIQTGDGGDPFSESGFTGWFDLDYGNAIISTGPRSSAVVVGPCAQTGVLSLRVGAALTPSPVDLCQNAADAAAVPARHIGPGTRVTLTSKDNRGEYFLNPNGALVSMTVPLGEPDSVPAVGIGKVGYPTGGFPACTAFIRIRTVRCTGLVPLTRYRLLRRGRTVARGRAGDAGAVTLGGVPVRGGDVLTLVNAAGRRLTALHVAHLRVGIVGNQTIIASGTCQPGDYWGGPVPRRPPSPAVGLGIGGSGVICPPSGRAKGLPAGVIAQTDDFSGGETETQVPLIQSTAPVQDETLYGGFVASAQSGLPGPHGSVSAGGVPIALTIRPAGSRRPVFHAANVDTRRGVAVAALAPGAYVATWVLHDAAGDTRTVTTRFVDER
ncbi:MAG TPA: hypothetical protein VFN87_18010 [Solirubrobacteraceae bacterium]|nr:hypothetical protein [Solirubrobacteraceae bacterium]